MVLAGQRLSMKISYNNGERKSPFLIDPGEAYKLKIDNSTATSARIKISNIMPDPADVLIGVVLYRYRDKMAAACLRGTGETNLVVPYLVDQGGWWSSASIINPGTDNEHECKIEAKTPVRGGDVGRIEPLELSAGENLNLGSGDWNPAAYALELGNSCPLVATAFVGHSDNCLGAYNVLSPALRHGCFAGLGKTSTSQWSGIVLYNPESSDAVVTLSAYSETGDRLAVREAVIAAGDSLVGVPETLLGEFAGTATHLEFTSDRGLHGLLLNYQDEDGGSNLDALSPLPIE
jgi:hypothetical protein